MTLARVGRLGRTLFARRLVRIAGFVFYLLAVQALVTAGVGGVVFLGSRINSDLVLPAVSLLLAGSYAVVGYHLRRYRLWARNFAFAFAGISLLAFPLGTGLGLVIVGCVASANRARIFPALRRRSSEEDWLLLRLEPEFLPERAG